MKKAIHSIAFLAFFLSAATAQTVTTTRITVGTSDEAPDGQSQDVHISQDGQFVVFSSNATNLVANDTNGASDIFVYNVNSSAVTRVSVSTAGVQGNDDSFQPAISADGTWVVFASSATNLVANDTNSRDDVFLHNTQTGVTTRVSVDSLGNQSNNTCVTPAISGDGTVVAFRGFATNLVANDTNNVNDIFVHDLNTGATTRVSVSTGGTQGDDDSYWPSLSSDGRYVAFESFATNLVAGDTNSLRDVFVHDNQLHATTRVSTAADGTQGNASSHLSKISADGLFVVFVSSSITLVPSDTNGSTSDVYLKNLQTGAIEIVSLSNSGAQTDANCSNTDISSDARFIMFTTAATNLNTHDVNGTADLYIRDRQNSTVALASLSQTGAQLDLDVEESSMADDGLSVVYTTSSTNLATPISESPRDAYLTIRTSDTSVHQSLILTITRGIVKNVVKDNRDSCSVTGTIQFGPLTPDATFDPSAEDVLVALNMDYEVTHFMIPAGDPAWRSSKNGTLTWKSPKGTSPVQKLTINLAKHKFSLTATKIQMPSIPPLPPMFAMQLGDELGIVTGAWNKKLGKTIIYKY